MKLKWSFASCMNSLKGSSSRDCVRGSTHCTCPAIMEVDRMLEDYRPLEKAPVPVSTAVIGRGNCVRGTCPIEASPGAGSLKGYSSSITVCQQDFKDPQIQQVAVASFMSKIEQQLRYNKGTLCSVVYFSRGTLPQKRVKGHY